MWLGRSQPLVGARKEREKRPLIKGSKGNRRGERVLSGRELKQQHSSRTPGGTLSSQLGPTLTNRHLTCENTEGMKACDPGLPKK